MRTVTFESVLHGVARRMGIDVRAAGSGGNLDPATAGNITEYIQTCYEFSWEYYWWPEAMTVEQRTVDANQLIAYAQSGETVIGEMRRICQRDPRKKGNPGEVKWIEIAEGFYVETANASATLWVDYRAAITAFTDTAYDNSTAYVIGNTVYYPTSQASGTGDCYRCIANSTGNLPSDDTYWSKIPFMSILAEAVKTGAYMLSLMEDGQYTTSQILDNYMAALLDHKVDRVETTQPSTFKVETRAVPN